MPDKIKVCILSDSHHVFDDRIYWKEAISLFKHGYDVHVLAMGDKNESGVSPEGIPYIVLEKKIYLRNRILNKLFKKIMGKEFYVSIYHEALKVKADVYHYHDLNLNKIAGKLKKLPWFPKVIYDVHEDFLDMNIEYQNLSKIKFLNTVLAKKKRKTELDCSIKIDHVISVSEHVKNIFTNKLNEQKLSIIYNFTNLKPEDSSTYEKSFDLIYTGGISRERGCIEIIEAVNICKTINNIKIKALLIGKFLNESVYNQAIELIEKHKLHDHVVLENNVPFREISDYYRRSRIGLGIFYPINMFYYGIQVKTFEYMAFGLPIICSNFGNIAEFVKESDTGLLVDPQSPSEIAKAITYLLDNHEAYKKFSQNGLKAAKEKFNWTIEEQKLLNLYKNLTN